MDNREKAAIVLVADDDNAVRQFVRTAIEQIGMEVCEASNGREVMQQFTLRHPDIIVLDVMMPVMDGFAACSKLRGESGGGQIPILMMTGLDDADAIARAYEHGATDFIAKPLNPTMLSQRIRYLLRGSQTLRALLRSEARLGLAQRIAKILDASDSAADACDDLIAAANAAGGTDNITVVVARFGRRLAETTEDGVIGRGDASAVFQLDRAMACSA